tara:strand:- start:3502 stop:4167 length:666 start_codon:yes stop_codon:yes gene_type:complete
MNDCTLIIPAKYESESLPKVLEELESFKFHKIIILEEKDEETISSIKNYNCKIIFQSGKGYGNALIEGINNVETEHLCIFNADGSFDPKYLENMLSLCEEGNEFIFCSRYLKKGGSEDDTVITLLGNYIFSKLGRIFFSLKISDILYTYILGKTKSFKLLNLKSNDFSLCVEIPINIKKRDLSYTDIPSFERKRIAGFKKVNAFRDGFKILFYMMKRFIFG